VQRINLARPTDDELSLLELADRLLNRGVVITGEATISVAGVDLIYLGLNVVLTAVENLKPRPPESASAPPARPDDA
jgi:gas vesicle structural protein